MGRSGAQKCNWRSGYWGIVIPSRLTGCLASLGTIGLPLQVDHIGSISLRYIINCGTWLISWLSHCAAILKVVGSIPSGGHWDIYWPNSSSCTIALGSTQSVTEMNNSGGGGDKACRCVGLTSLQLSCADCTEILSHSSS